MIYLIMLLCLFMYSFIADHLDPINVKIAELREALESVTAEQKYLKAREARHRRSKSLIQLTYDFWLLRITISGHLSV